MFTNTRRIIKSGFVNFWRNGFVSIASVLVMTITLFVLGFIVFGSALLTSSLEEIKSRVDVNVYFIGAAAEDDILSVKRQLEAMPEVASVEYVSRDTVLENFKERHANDEITLQALEELNDNPFGAVLNIRAKETSQYESIAQFFDTEEVVSSNGTPIIDKINYFENKAAIDNLSRVIEGGRQLGVGITLVLVVLSVMITLNTIRLAIYIARDEIAVMRLVGASNKYIRGPFVVAGAMYGVIAGIITLALFYPATFWLARLSENFFGGLNIFDYYVANFLQIFLLIMCAGVILGVIASYMAVRRYLRV